MFQLEPESFAFHNHKKQCLALIREDMAEEMTESEENIVFVFIFQGLIYFMKTYHTLGMKYQKTSRTSEQRNNLCNVKNDFLITYFNPLATSLPVQHCTVLYRPRGCVACSFLRRNLRSRFQGEPTVGDLPPTNVKEPKH